MSEKNFRGFRVFNLAGSQNLLKSCLSFGEGLEDSNGEKMGRQQKEEVL